MNNLDHLEDVAIVGAGPAGAYCAFELARAGIFATVFDSSHPREKPCGGGITPSALKEFPFLEQFRAMSGGSNALKMISCTNNHTAIMKYRGFNLSRQFLDQQFIDMALHEGAKLVKEKVISVRRKGHFWLAKTDRQLMKTRIIVGADGVLSLVRQITVGRISRENLGLTYGYFASGVENEPTTIKFTAEIPGYIWVFPRKNDTSLGIGSESKYGCELKSILDNYIHIHYPQAKVIKEFAAILPRITDPDFFSRPCAGTNWALIGDAAGHVDPLSGEGIMYALWSGKLAAEAITRNNPCCYDRLWREKYGALLEERCKQRKTFYDPLAIELSIALQTLQSDSKYFSQ